MKKLVGGSMDFQNLIVIDTVPNEGASSNDPEPHKNMCLSSFYSDINQDFLKKRKKVSVNIDLSKLTLRRETV